MNPMVWIQVLGHAVAGVLEQNGKTEQAGFIRDGLTAAREGKNVDDVMLAAAQSWDLNGPPTVDELAAARREIQGRIDG